MRIKSRQTIPGMRLIQGAWARPDKRCRQRSVLMFSQQHGRH